jgi:hypothetical protein
MNAEYVFQIKLKWVLNFIQMELKSKILLFKIIVLVVKIY